MPQMTSVVTTRILVLCSANQCRSPMAGVLLTRHLSGSPTPVAVRSAGLLTEETRGAGGGRGPGRLRPRHLRAPQPPGHRIRSGLGGPGAGHVPEHVRHAVVTAAGHLAPHVHAQGTGAPRTSRPGPGGLQSRSPAGWPGLHAAGRERRRPARGLARRTMWPTLWAVRPQGYHRHRHPAGRSDATAWPALGRGLPAGRLPG